MNEREERLEGWQSGVGSLLRARRCPSHQGSSCEQGKRGAVG